MKEHNPIEIKIPWKYHEIVLERVVNSILEGLPENYIHIEDVFELKELCRILDIQIRNECSRIT